ncbi:MAG TPA: hypothetical protein VLM11_03600 [Streptosporangiaceae bacterium]|nr:hypothetical protein [Streptosporangiaceae bacterium]
MAELLGADDLLEDALTAALGPVGQRIGEAIAGICKPAPRDVHRPVIISAVHADHRLLALIAHWAWDLAHGVQFQSQAGA